jgi:glutamyl-tRNA synthetase/glutamyl-Q tRNA(Asp) synthetase
VDLVVRGEDLLGSTGRQLRLGRLLGRDRPPMYLHHPLINRPDGSKLSKADGDTGIRELRAAGAGALRPIPDQRARLREDVDRIRAAIPDDVLVLGTILDLRSGRLTVV